MFTCEYEFMYCWESRENMYHVAIHVEGPRRDTPVNYVYLHVYCAKFVVHCHAKDSKYVYTVHILYMYILQVQRSLISPTAQPK